MAGSRYVRLTLAVMEAFLRSKSPRIESGRAGNEVVLYARHPRCPDVRVEIFTSVGAGDETVRPCGQDAIKVCCTYDDGYKKRFGLMRESVRILRVGSEAEVLNRVYGAVVRCHAQANLWLKLKGAGQDPTLRPDWRSDCPSPGSPLLDA